MPRVSVIMPMYNALPYLGEAIESIISQTFQDWELLIIDDASTDGSADAARQYAAKDKRITLIRNDSGQHGAGPARNIGLDHAKGEYVAMMDADDISLPTRLTLQVGFMDKHPNVALSNCWTRVFGVRKRTYFPFTSDLMIRALITFYPILLPASSVIFRRAAVHEKYPALKRGEDGVFCLNIIMRYKTANLPKILYLYRVTEHSFAFHPDWLAHERKKLEVLLPLRLGFTPTAAQIDTHLSWEKCTNNVSIWRKCEWIIYVVRHGAFTWYERPIVIAWYVMYGFLKKAYLMWFGK